MLKYTICFIRQGDRILMLNRQYPVWMGIWNGVGGKLNDGESPMQCILREVYEETGLQLYQAEAKGIVTWTVDGSSKGGMYAFTAQLPQEVVYQTPRITEEGILDWKEISWILHPENLGIATNIPYYLPTMLNDTTLYEHHCTFENGMITAYHGYELMEEYIL